MGDLIMKAATRIVLCSLVALLLQLSLAYAAPPLAGKWVNVDASTNSIARLEVTEKADGWFIHAWAKCGPPDCDWGTVPLHMAVDSDGPDQPIDAQRLTHGVAYWDHKENDAKADIRTFMTLQVRNGELVVESFDVFGKASGRPKEMHHTRAKDSFKKAE
jgi:hypothetical protein